MPTPIEPEKNSREIRARYFPIKLVSTAQLQHVQLDVHLWVVRRRTRVLGLGLLLRIEDLPLRGVLVADIENQPEARRVLQFVPGFGLFFLEGAAEAVSTKSGYLGGSFLRLQQCREEKHR
jgi:hypothetical protein